MRRLAVFVCSVGYIGFFPIAPGTVGSAAGIAVYLAVRAANVPGLDLVLILGMFAAGAILVGSCERDLQCIDPGPVVIDEVMGMLITLAAIPVGPAGIVLGFFLFRILDIVKPFPARQLERLPGGLGVMADDAMAAIYANLLLRGVHALAPGWL